MLLTKFHTFQNHFFALSFGLIIKIFSNSLAKMRLRVCLVLLLACQLNFSQSRYSDKISAGLVSKSADDLFNEFWEWRLLRSPEFSTLSGSKEHNSILETFTEERFANDNSFCETMKVRAEELLDQTDDEGLKLNIRFLIAELGTFINGYPFKGFFFPINYMEGVQVDFEKLIDWTSFDSKQDYLDIINRFEAFDDLAEQIIRTARVAITQGQTNHAVSMAGTVKQCDDIVNKASRESSFFKVFHNMTNVAQEDIEALQNSAASAIESSVQVGFQKISNFLTAEYIPATRPEIATSSLPDNGPEHYKACLAFHTSTDMTAQEIHDTGIQEVERIEDEMREIIKEMGYDLTLPEFTDMIKNDKNNFFDSPIELLAAFKEIIEEKIEPKILQIFNNKPTTKLEILPIPASTPDAPAAFYIAGTPDGSRPGRLFVNVYHYDSQPRYEMISLTLHETIPGHHLQGSYMLEKKEWPMFRKVMEDRIYSQAPSRFPINTAYTEGWGLYSETLGFDLDLYSNPLDRYGHLSEEIFRACRLVVDTGMHALNWSREEAVQYMLAHTAASEDNIRGEIDRYITWPGQATGYKIGQIKIKGLRTLAETELGDQFDLKAFHEVVLESAGPLNILEEQINQFINTYKK